jgi:hypothetical protein
MASLSKKTKLFVAERASSCCEYCLSQQNYSPDYFTVEHVIPKVKKGSNTVENLAFACSGCNGHKYTHTKAIDPVSGLYAPLYNPRKDTWDEHFKWDLAFSIITGITPTGRATVEKLRLNRISVVNLRLVLAQVGMHPPK